MTCDEALGRVEAAPTRNGVHPSSPHWWRTKGPLSSALLSAIRCTQPAILNWAREFSIFQPRHGMLLSENRALARTGSGTDASDPSERCTEDDLPPAPIQRHSTSAIVVTTRLAEDGIGIHNVVAKPPASIKIPGPHTARNVLKFSLQTLSKISSNIPFGEILGSVIDPLLEIADRIEQTSTNAVGLFDLATRIALLGPIVTEMAKIDESRGRKMAEALEREIKSITEDLRNAEKQNKLKDFFNSVETASIVANHNSALDRLVGDANFVNIHENMKYIREALLKWQSSPVALFEGGVGGTGGKAWIGGEGGDGEGPRVEMRPGEHWKVEKISGGTGGGGGMGIDTGGKGGTGKAPELGVRRTQEDSGWKSTVPQSAEITGSVPDGPHEVWRPTLHGGVGGAGGKGGQGGGKGGAGQGAQIQPANVHLVSAIYGGVGGKGGDVDPACHGFGAGGDGGIGERGGIIEPLYLPYGNVVRAGEDMLLPEFCARFNISEAINHILTAEGFSTAGALLGTPEGVFSSCGLRPGHIGELTRALGEWKCALREKGEVD
ncbi:hypothetical protein C8R43DRAFT_957062 [Mycena crocata]|nr:hypothetical protein C8R43DRAFT_957062 [Mycena crocata]